MGGFCHATLHPTELYRNKLTGFYWPILTLQQQQQQQQQTKQRKTDKSHRNMEIQEVDSCAV
jgi:hypothetical protein